MDDREWTLKGGKWRGDAYIALIEGMPVLEVGESVVVVPKSRLDAAYAVVRRLREIAARERGRADRQTDLRLKAVAAAAERERALTEALKPFAYAAATSRMGDGGALRPEADTMKVEVKAGDWLRACVVLGRMDADYLRALPLNARPSDAFLAALPVPAAEEPRGMLACTPDTKDILNEVRRGSRSVESAHDWIIDMLHGAEDAVRAETRDE